jgi:hypothetical protein
MQWRSLNWPRAGAVGRRDRMTITIKERRCILVVWRPHLSECLLLDAADTVDTDGDCNPDVNWQVAG